MSSTLHVAAFHDRPDEVRACLSKGAAPDIQALLIACQRGNPECIQVLLAAGASANGEGDQSPLCMALRAKQRRAACLELLLTARADIGQPGPLHEACRIGDLQCVQMLLCAGAQHRQQNAVGQSAMDVADLNEADRGPARLLGDLDDAPLLCAEVQVVSCEHAGRYGMVAAFDRTSGQYLVAPLDLSLIHI